MSVQDNLRPTHKEKTTYAMKAPYAVKRITFDRSEANPGDKLYVHVPRLNARPHYYCAKFMTDSSIWE